MPAWWRLATPNLRGQPPLWAGRGLPAVAVETRARTRFRTELVPLREGRVGHRLLARPGDFRPEEIAEYRRERSPAHLRVRDATALHHVSSSRHIRSARISARISAASRRWLAAYRRGDWSHDHWYGVDVILHAQLLTSVRLSAHISAHISAYLSARFSAHTWACTSAVSRRRTARATLRRRTSSSSRCTSRSATTRTGILLFIIFYFFRTT